MASRELLDAAPMSGGCMATCEACGREYFTIDGHYDWEENELEDLIKKSEEEPDKYIGIYYDSVETVYINGQVLVIDCECGAIERIEKGIWSNRDWIMRYLQSMLMKRRHEIDREIQNAYVCMDELAQCHIHNLENENRLLRRASSKYVVETDDLVRQRLDAYTKHLERENEALRKIVPKVSKFDLPSRDSFESG